MVTNKENTRKYSYHYGKILLLRLVTPIYTENNRHDIWEPIFFSALALFLSKANRNNIRKNEFNDINDFSSKRSDY